MKIALRNLREKQKLTQEALAVATGMSQQLYRAYESGKVKRPNLDYLERFCRILKCEIGEILIREPDE
ncbi:MAG TPA: transcriptional regulator [Cyanobacteria bacterium UBA9226]|nr:transcriptional regulator [Cyanobacteria bacterium UBA9226]